VNIVQESVELASANDRSQAAGLVPRSSRQLGPATGLEPAPPAPPPGETPPRHRWAAPALVVVGLAILTGVLHSPMTAAVAAAWNWTFASVRPPADRWCATVTLDGSPVYLHIGDARPLLRHHRADRVRVADPGPIPGAGGPYLAVALADPRDAPDGRGYMPQRALALTACGP
jgi:hypothetical protein